MRFAVSRPFVRDVVAVPATLAALAGESTTLRYSLVDDGPDSLSVSARVDGGTGAWRGPC